MQVNISTRHGHLSDKTREKIAQKAERLTRIFERVTSISVTVDLDDQRDRGSTSMSRLSTSAILSRATSRRA